MLDQAQLAKVVDLLEGRFGLEALLLFGSEARGGARADSDVDLAALFPSPADVVALLEAGADIERLLGRSVDLVDLGAAPPILAVQVLRDGRCIAGAGSRALAEFTAIVPSRYADLKRVRAAAEAALVDRGSPVIDRDLVLAKVESLDRCLARIAEVRSETAALRAIDVQDITVLNLQRAVQAMIDLAAHVVAGEGFGTPDSLGASFTLLARAGILDDDLADRMRRMTGFRNVAVHEYRRLDPAVLEAIVRTRLGDLRAFAGRILQRAGMAPGDAGQPS